MKVAVNTLVKGGARISFEFKDGRITWHKDGLCPPEAKDGFVGILRLALMEPAGIAPIVDHS